MSVPPNGQSRSPGMSIMSLLSDDNQSQPAPYQQPQTRQDQLQQPQSSAQYATTFSYSQIQPKSGPEFRQYQPPEMNQSQPQLHQYQTQYQHQPAAQAAPALAPATPVTPATPAAPAALAAATQATVTPATATSTPTAASQSPPTPATAPQATPAKKKAATPSATTKATSTTTPAKRKKTDEPAKKTKKKQKKDEQPTVGSIPIVTGTDESVTARPKENIPPPPSVAMSPGKKQAQGLDSIGQNKDNGRGSKPEVTLRLRVRLAGGNVKVKPPSQSVLKKPSKNATGPEHKQYIIDNQEYDFYSTPDKANDWTASADDTTVLNFIRLAEDKYGYEYVHPNQALDLVDDDGEVEDDDDEEEDKEKEEKEMKRRQRVEGKYDLNDPFIDDTETAWEEQQASTQDGFFVYSGPLIEEPAKPAEAKKPAKKPGPKKKAPAATAKEPETKKKAASTTNGTTASTPAVVDKKTT